MPFELDPADHAFGKGDPLAGDVGPNRREHALHAGARVRGAADDLDRLVAGVDYADLEPVGVRMRPGFDHPGDDEAVVFGAGVLDALHFEADAGQGVDDLGERSGRVEMIEEPGEGELHRFILFGTAQ